MCWNIRKGLVKREQDKILTPCFDSLASLKRKDYVTVAESIASENYVCKSMMTSLSSAALLIFLSCQSENIYYIENHS